MATRTMSGTAINDSRGDVCLCAGCKGEITPGGTCWDCAEDNHRLAVMDAASSMVRLSYKYHRQPTAELRAEIAALGSSFPTDRDAMVEAYNLGKLPEVTWESKDGDRVIIGELTGYKNYNNRPFGKYGMRVSGPEWDGWIVYHAGTVFRHIMWMDNSNEVEVICDDGTYRRRQVVAPHGDRCF